MKKTKLIARILLALMLVSCFVCAASSCSRPPELSEIKGEIETLIAESQNINSILFGKGLDTDDRLESPFENYKCVAFDTGFFSVDDIKEAAEKVYTKEYLEPIYEVTFTGKYDSVAGSIIRARYMDSEGYLLKHIPVADVAVDEKEEDPNNILGDETRTYDFSTIVITKPSRADYVTFEIMSSKNGKSEKLTLAIALTSDGWRLDYPTY